MTTDIRDDGLEEAVGWALSLIEDSADLMCVCREGRIRFLNAGGARLFGLAAADLALGRSFVDFVHADYVDPSIDLLAYLADQGEALPVKLAGRDGHDRDVEIRARRQRDGGDATVLVSGHDLTDKLVAARLQHQREQNLRDIIDAIPAPVLVVQSEGGVEFCNRAAEGFFGLPLREIMGRPAHRLFGGGEPPSLAAVLGAPGKPILERIADPPPARRFDGRLTPVDISLTALTRGERRVSVLVIEPRMAGGDPAVADGRGEDPRLAGRIIETLEEAVVIADSGFRITYANPAFTRITGFQATEMVGCRPSFLDVVERDENLHARMWRAVAGTGSWEAELWNRRKDGTEYAEHIALSAIKDHRGNVVEYAAVVSDITQRKRDEERLRYQANYDVLTGLPNRTLLLDRIHLAIAAAARDEARAGLLVIDLDGFKLVNDTFGHEVGDLLLQEASRRLTACVRTGDTVARLGGDEFTVLMTSLDDPRHAPRLAERMLEALAKPFVLRGQDCYITGSIGITVFPEDGKTVGDLLRNADAAMYRAKEQGKANYQFYTADLNAEVHARLALKNGLKAALARCELALHYQPKLDIASGRVSGAEALMRWTSRELGSVPPSRFIPVLEETGMVVEAGAWAIREACLRHRAWREAGLPPVRVAVNLSPRQLREKDFTDTFTAILAETGVGPEGIEVEVTESILMSDTAHGIRTLGALHEMGVHIAMDDFGTGYSSLSYLKRFPIDVIKIDRSFVMDIAADPDDAEIVRTIIGMGHALNRRVIAEGVETPEQFAILRDYGCDEIQGYLFSRPLPAEEATRFLRDREPRTAGGKN